MSEWRDIPGFEGRYAVSDDGRVRSLARVVIEQRRGYVQRRPDRVLRLTLNKSGYPMVVLYDTTGRRHTRLVHRLVLTAFVGPCPEGMEACHWDGDRTNAALGNLRWDTLSANAKDKQRHGTDPRLRVTVCPQGHAYTPSNTRTRRTRSGGTARVCKSCERAYNRRRWANRAA